MSMDSLHTIGFFLSAALAVAGGLSVAFLPDRPRRGLAMAVVAIGVAGIYLSLSAGFAALVALICYVACALVLAGSAYRVVEPAISARWRQLGAVGAAALIALLGYAAFRGYYPLQNLFFGGPFGSAALGRQFFAHDALATEAVAALVLVSLVGAALAWRARERGR
jgi:NADH:ubiquinone oxidoreductase subunit 6 (subunit J)